MSWIKRRPLLAIAALAFAVRAASAVVTEFKPIFPAYYYTDAKSAHEEALAGLAAVRAGQPIALEGNLSHRLHILMTIGVYRALGPSELGIKLFNAAVGAAGIAALAGAFGYLFTPAAALAAGAALALWPSDAFYTSQNLKESPTLALAFIGLLAAFPLGLRPPLAAPRRSALAALLFCSLVGVGLLRSYILLCMAGALIAAFALEARSPELRSRSLRVVAVSALAMALYPVFSHALYAGLQRSGEAGTRSAPDNARIQPSLIPETISDNTRITVYRPTSPEGLSAFRHTRQFNDRRFAWNAAGREIGTQIFPDVIFHSWLDVLLYLPKGAFYVLFMPLPGLYPMDGKLGRIAAAAENLILLAFACLAAAGFWRGPKNAGRVSLILFFAGMTIGSALLEFDLGSAARHKLLYLPMLFPFAAEELLRLLGREERV
ncbi:MAG TPA: hypothetical protein VN915_03910 [Elusimicrobiota bacterium]|nr:hypothetical protein [Elusimicrobiota bacterium]